MKFAQTLLALALAGAIGSTAVAQADSSILSPVLELEVSTDGLADGWKVNLSNAGIKEATWDSVANDWAWGTITAATPFSQDILGNWSLTQAWAWSDSNKTFEISIAAKDVYGNLDPFINYTMSVKNNSNNVKTFQKVVTAPIVPTISGPNTVRASVGGGTSDATGDGVTITPLPNRSQDGNNGNELQLFLLSSTNNFSTLGSYTNAGVDVGLGETEGGPAGAYTYGPYAEGPIAGPLGSWNYMQTRTRFSLTGGGDTAAITGYAEITAVPEAKTYAMMIAGLGLVGFMVRRRYA